MLRQTLIFSESLRGTYTLPNLPYSKQGRKLGRVSLRGVLSPIAAIRRSGERAVPPGSAFARKIYASLLKLFV